ncbi:uncharacterized protein [Centruroides vittatus]|uniref:uncharacterized protein n=1 Tax=Centruroides vittatus TaxID=120091 RepID=UPI00350F7367
MEVNRELKMAESEAAVYFISQNQECQIDQITSAAISSQHLSNNSTEVENGKQFSVLLKHCKDVHIGPRIENYFQQPIVDDVTKQERLSKNVKRLKNVYQTKHAYMRSFLWQGKRKDFAIKDHFVELVVEKASLYGKKLGEKINITEIFGDKESEEDHQTILVTGDPGYGKTTLCKKIAYDWSSKEPSIDYCNHFHVVVIIILRDLGDKSIKNEVLNNIFQNPTVQDENLLQNLNILVILDGFDEASDKSKVVKFVRNESFDISF